jgi:hypothetical protein
MRSTVAIMVMTGLTLFACSKSDDKAATTTTSAVAATAVPATNAVPPPPAPTQAPAAAAVATSPQMTAFMSMLDGKNDSARKALKKFGAKAAIQNDDLGMYTLQDPKVTKSEKVGDQQCYTMESTAGVMTHTTQVCWDAKGKIAKISDTSA